MISYERLKAMITASTEPDGGVLAWTLCYAVEREAREQALEEAIAECSDMLDNSDGSHGWNRACKRCAAAIRALTGK